MGMADLHRWRVTNGRVSVKGRDGREHRYAPGDEFVCDEGQLAWRREQVECLGPYNPNEGKKKRLGEVEQVETESTSVGTESTEPEATHQVRHRGGGWYDVVDSEGNRINDEALRYEDAAALVGQG